MAVDWARLTGGWSSMWPADVFPILQRTGRPVARVSNLCLELFLLARLAPAQKRWRLAAYRKRDISEPNHNLIINLLSTHSMVTFGQQKESNTFLSKVTCREILLQVVRAEQGDTD